MTRTEDPWLSSNIGTVTVLERPLDFDGFRRRIAGAVAEIPRMWERVVPAVGRLAPPTWVPDPEFRLDYHLRRIALPEPGSEQQLFDLAAAVLQEPLDRARPLWQFVVIDGLAEGRGALFTKLHHTITDGKGGVRLAEKYMEVSPDEPPPPEVDLDAVIADAVADHRAAAGGGGQRGFGRSLAGVAGHVVRRQLGIVRRVAGEAGLVAVDPGRVLEAGGNLVKGARSARAQVAVGAPSGGSPLWRTRSRHREFQTDASKEAARRPGIDCCPATACRRAVWAPSTR